MPKIGTVSFRFLSQHETASFLPLNFSPNTLDSKPSLYLFNKTDATYGNTLSPAAFSLISVIVDDLLDPLTILLGKMFGI